MVKVYAANKQYLQMSEDEVWTFLNERKIMTVATVTEEGIPHNTPVWYIVHNKKIYFRAQTYKVKIINIKTKHHVSCVVEDGENYSELKGVMIQGDARIVNDDDFAYQMNENLLSKYVEERKMDLMPDKWKKARRNESRSIVEIMPLRVASWDNSKLIED